MDGKAITSTNLGAITAHYGKQRKEVKRYFERRRNRELKKSAAMRDDQLFLFADETNKAITNGVSDSNSSNSGPIAAVDNSVTPACTTNKLSLNQTQLHEQGQQKKNKQNVQNTSKAQTNSVHQQELESAPTHKVNTITTIINNTTTGNTEITEDKPIENSINSCSDNTNNVTKTKKTKKKKNKATKINGLLENKADNMPHENNAVKLINNKTSNNDDSTSTLNNNDISKSNGTDSSDSVNKPALPTHNKYMIDKQLICYHNHQNNTITNNTSSNMLHAETEIQEKPCTTALNNLHEHEEEWSSACMTVATCPQECERACCSFTKSKSNHNSASPKPTLISILPILEAMHNAHCGKTKKCTSTKACSGSAQCGSTNVKENNKSTEQSTSSFSSSSAPATSTSFVSSSPTAMECNTKGKCITPTNSISSGGDGDSNEGICKSENAAGSSLLTSSSSFSSSEESSSNSGLENLLIEAPTCTNNNNKNIIIATTTERSDTDIKHDVIEKKHSNSSCSSETSSLLLSRSKSKSSSSPVRVMSIDGSATHATRLQEDELPKTQEKDEHSEHYYSNNSNKYNSSSPCIVTSMVRRLDQVPPLPITRPLSSGTSLNVPTRNYLLLDREYNLHQFAPGFKRNDELALESLLETASLEWHKIQKHSCEALLDSSTNVECDMCNRMNNSFVITTANAMKALFQVGYMAHKKLALKVIRIGPDIVIDTCAASCYGDHSSVYDLRRQALIGKALYRLREESSKVFDHEEEEEEMVHHDEEINHQVNVNSPSSNSNINGNKETNTTPVNTCRDIIPLSRQASLNFFENNHITDNKMRNTSVNNNGAIRANPLSSALVAHKREYSRFSQVMYWNIDALELLVGVDVPIILDVRTNTEHLLRLMDEADDEENALHSEQLYCDALNCWFDATIANVPEVGVYIHNAGVIQRFELKKVNELLSRVQGKVAAMSMNFTSNVLQWIVSQCVEDKATYIVVRGDESAYLKMYKIPAEEVSNTDYCSNGDNTTSSTNNCTTTTQTTTATAASTEKNTNNNTKKEQEELQENYANTEKESMNMKEDNVEELKHSQTKQHYGQEDMTCNPNRQHETALGHDGVRLTSKMEKNEEYTCNNKLNTVSTVHAKENECEHDKMSGVVCLYNNTKETPVYTPNVQGELLCITNKNEEGERQREEKKKCLDAEEAHKERLSVSLAQMCYAMGVHLHSEADKRKANEAIGLLRRTFLIHVRRIHDSRAKEMVMDVVQRLPSLIGLMLSTM